MTGDDAKLRAAFRALDEVERGDGASAAVEARLRAQVRSIAAARRRDRIHRVLAMAAMVLIAVTGVRFVSVRKSDVDKPDSARVTRESAYVARRAAEEMTAFLPLPYSGVPMLDGQIVRLEVPRAALASFGLTPPEAIDAEVARGTVLADVLVGEDGLARAVRFVRLAPSPEQQQEKQEQQR